MSHFIQKKKNLLLFFFISLFFVGCISDTGLDSEKDQVVNAMIKQIAPTNHLDRHNLDSETLSMISDLREATDQYHQLKIAEADGYELGSECVAVPNLGGMGYHFVNFPAIFAGYDPLSPQTLLYEKTKNGRMRLVGVEFVIDKATWDAENEWPPHFGSREFDFDNAQALPFTNYQLHVWIWKHNPSGIFTKFNPKVSCE